MFRSDEHGVALLVALFMTLIVSALGAGMIFVARTETLSSQSYRTTSQARYAAESGLAAAANYLLSSDYEAVAPGTGADPLANYDATTSPVTLGGDPVVISTEAGQSNYPVGGVVTAFTAAASGTLPQAGATTQFGASARLLALRQVGDTMSGGTRVLQTWEITGIGRLGGSGSAEVQVTAIIERHSTATFRYAAFATNIGCDSLIIAGGAFTDSYDSTTVVGGAATFANASGDIGTNGNLDISGGSGTIVNGTLSTPRTGVGNCTAANVTAMSVAGKATVSGGLVELPQAVAYPPPPAIDPLPPTTSVTMNSGFGCASVPPGCAQAGSTITLTPVGGAPYTLGNVSVTSGKTLQLNAGTYVVNSLSVAGGSMIQPVGVGPVIIRVAGENLGAGIPAVSIGGNALQNPSLNPANFQIVYGGTGIVNVAGGTSSAALIYAPNANVSITGNSDFYGAVIAGRVNLPGGARIHYDRNLNNSAVTTGNPVMTSFTWRAF